MLAKRPRIRPLRPIGNERERVVLIPKQLAKATNSMRAAQAERYVYANRKDYGIEKLCCKWLSGPKEPMITSGQDTPVIEVKRNLSE